MFKAIQVVGNHLAVCRCLVFDQLPVDDDTGALFGQQQGVAELHLRPGFTTDQHMNVGLVQAQDLVLVGQQATADDSLVRLPNRRGKLRADPVHSLDDHQGLCRRQIRPFPLTFQ